MSAQNNRRDERWLTRELKEINRRLRGLETAPRAGNTSIASGQMASTNFNPGVAGWGVDGTGHAEFNDVALTGGSLIVQQTGQGVFVYDGAPALGNLIVSIASAAGVDDFGNSYPKGIDVSEGAIAGSQITIEPGPDNGIFVYGVTPTVTTLTSGSGTWVCPAGVTSVKVEAWGGGGGGGDYASSQAGGGGGGGEYAAEATLAVTPGNSYAYVVGAGGAAGTGGGDGGNAGDSTFGATLVVAHGGGQGFGSGFGVRGGGGTGSTNTTHFNGAEGSDGGDGVIASASLGGAGGGSGGYASAGNPPTGFSTPGLPATAVTGGSAGGAGGTTTKAGTAGGAPGGGGGGAGSQGLAGAGANGRVAITYVPARTLLASIAGAPGTDPYGNAYPAGLAGASLALDGVDVTGAWQSYTPAWTASGTNPTLGSGSITGRYMRIGKTVHVSITIAGGSGTTPGTGTYLFGLPFTSANHGVGYVGAARFTNTSPSTVVYIGQVTLGANSAVMNATFPVAATPATASNMTAAVPAATSSTTTLTMSLTYQTA